jgi:hypothetical protein
MSDDAMCAAALSSGRTERLAGISRRPSGGGPYDSMHGPDDG